MTCILLALLLVPAALLVPAERTGDATMARSATPVVMLVLDEFTGTSLLDARNEIDPARYPHFAALAGDGTYYRNFTAAADETTRVMAALMTGGMWNDHAHPTAAYYPRNLFTLFGPTYRLRVREAASDFCPRRLCHAAPHDKQAILHELGGGRRPAGFDSWLQTIDGRADNTLYFKHLLLPHVPWQYLPDGQMYRRHPVEYVPGLNGPPSFSDTWLLQQGLQRHLFQVALVDRILGRLVDRLERIGLYEKALIVVTADNGESFLRKGHDRHIADAATFTDIASTPLLIKRPGQHDGGYDDRHVRTFDVVPTIADAVGLKLPWRVLGRSIFRSKVPDRVEVHREQFGKGGVFSVSMSGYERARRRALDRKIALFGSGADGPGVFGIGPNRALIGRSVDELRPTDSTAVRGRITAEVRGLLGRVDTSSGFLPANVTGTVAGARRGTPVALALNGRIAAVGRTAQLAGDRHVYFSFFAPPAAFADGRNRAEVFTVGAGERLERIAAA